MAALQSLQVELKKADVSRVLNRVGNRGVQGAHVARCSVLWLQLGKMRAHECSVLECGFRNVRKLYTKVGNLLRDEAEEAQLLKRLSARCLVKFDYSAFVEDIEYVEYKENSSTGTTMKSLYFRSSSLANVEVPISTDVSTEVPIMPNTLTFFV